MNNEERLARDLGVFFRKLKKEVLKALEEYWSDYQMLQGHINLICSPVHEAHREYYELLKKYIKKEYKLGQQEATRLVNKAGVRYAWKETINMPLVGFIKRDNDLFATIPKAESDLLNRTYRTSEQTLNRVDSQLNQIITDGYRSGKGINDVANQVTKRFDQLESWEARRIARTEINTSHNKATYDTYEDLGVEYTQWIAAGDDRTRDSHVEIDGEIIPIGTQYSNGLSYPGDMSGPIEEWINCRCSNAPFVIPYGYIAPSFSPFRESDLVPINNDAEPTAEQLQENLTESQRELYGKYQDEIKEAQGIIDSPFYTENEKMQARTRIDYNTSKLNQLKQVAVGNLNVGLSKVLQKITPTSEPTTSENDSTEESSYPQEYDKYALNEAELKRYEELKAKDESEGLKFKEKRQFRDLNNRKKFSDMWNSILKEGGDPHDIMAHPVQYEKLYNQFKDWERLESFESKSIQIKTENIFNDTDAFKLTPEEKKHYKQLKNNKGQLSQEQKLYYRELSDKVDLNILHKELLEGNINEYHSVKYVELYSKHKDWGLPKLSYELKFKVPKQEWEFNSVEGEIGNKYALSKKQAQELDYLQKKKLFADEGIDVKITSKELSRMEELLNQKHFNQLYYTRENEGGLSYNEYVEFKKLYPKFEKKLQLDKSLLDQELPKYTNNIKPEAKEKPLKLKGAHEDGLPPNHKIKDLFTVDVAKISANEQRVVTRWMGNDFIYFRDFVVRSKGDINTYVEYVINASPEQLKHYGYLKTLVEEGKIAEVKKQVTDIAKSLEHDLPVLNNILENNCTKKAMTMWRKETKHHLGKDPKPGDVVTFPGKNSVAITLEGAEHFAEVTSRNMDWTYEIEAPAGTHGAYVSHINQSERIRMEMEYLLADDTQMEIIVFDEANNYAKLRVKVK